MLKKLLAVAGLVGTLGAAAPAFADWYGPGPVVVTPPVAGPGYYRGRDDWRWRDRDDYWRGRDRDDWRWRHRRHEWREREWHEHHRW